MTALEAIRRAEWRAARLSRVIYVVGIGHTFEALTHREVLRYGYQWKVLEAVWP